MSSFGCTAKTRTVLAAGAAKNSDRRASAALSQGVDARRKLEVALGEAALGVGRERERHLVPGDRDVRVVVHLLGRGRDAVHEVDRALEVVELELAGDRVAVARPPLEAVEPGL